MKYVSGVRPSGHLHIGNYLGALRQWKQISEAGIEHHFFVADLHGQHSPDEIAVTQGTLASLGLHCPLQSAEPAVLHLAHELSFHVPIGWLKRMTQFKDKSQSEAATLALFAYPVLMAADILHHRATHVPVGADQKQHVEFVRDLVDSLPAKGFTKPDAVIGDYPRIMSLMDGTQKMSKSDPNDMSRINLTDSADAIRKKIRAAKTSMSPADVSPEAENLTRVYRAFCGDRQHERWPEFKAELVDLLVADAEKRMRRA